MVTLFLLKYYYNISFNKAKGDFFTEEMALIYL